MSLSAPDSGIPSHLRPGKRRVPVSEKPRAFRAQPVKSKARRSYTSRRKIEVLSYWATPSIPEEGDPTGQRKRVPTVLEVSTYFGGIPPASISRWRRDEKDILLCERERGYRVEKSTSGSSTCKWPEMEKVVYERFLQQREAGQIVRRGWFRHTSYTVFRECYPECTDAFRFSHGWFVRFLARYRITIRFTTNRAQKIPQDYLTPIINFFRFNRRNLQLREGDFDFTAESGLGRAIPSRIANMDQTPAPFEYLSGRTYALKGCHTVWAKAEKSGWDKRQATIQLTVLADGTMLKPWIIFKGKGNLPDAELNQYDKRVTVKFNDEGYANELIIMEWIQQQLLPVIHRSGPFNNVISTSTGLPTGVADPNAPGLIALDAASFHKTPTVLSTLRNANITPSLIPAGCTSLVQVLDVSVNRTFKDFLKEAMENELYSLVRLQGVKILAMLDSCDNGEEESLAVGVISAVGLRRILLTRAVGEAWMQFSAEKYTNMIIKTFRSVGLALPIDGSCDAELSVKGLTAEELSIGDWRQDLPVSNTSSNNSMIASSSASVPAAEQIDSFDDDEEIGLEGDENLGVYFVELDGAILQVGRLKKKKPEGSGGEMAGTGSKERRQVTCSACSQPGHNRRSQKCPAKLM